MTITERLARAIKADRFNWERYLCGSTWYGQKITTMPVFCSYGQIGYTVNIDGYDVLYYDYDLDRLTIY